MQGLWEEGPGPGRRSLAAGEEGAAAQGGEGAAQAAGPAGDGHLLSVTNLTVVMASHYFEKSF